MENIFLDSFSLLRSTTDNPNERLLRETIQIHQTMFDVVGTALVVIDEDTKILLANREMERLSGLDRTDIEGKTNITPFIHPKDLPRLLTYHKQRRTKEGITPHTYTFTFIDSCGREKEVLAKIRLIPGTKKSVAALTDLSEILALKEQLERSEEKFRLLFENAQEGIFQSTPEGKILLANPAFVKMLGYSSLQEVLELDMARDIFLDSNHRKEVLSQVDREKTVSNIETTWKKKDGTKIIVRTSGRVIREESGNILCYENTVVDITDLKEVQQELEASHQHSVSVVNCLPDPTFAIDMNGCVVAWNKAMEQLTGTSAIDMLGRGNYEYAIPLYGQRKPILIDYVLKPKRVKGDQYTYMRRKGDNLVAEAYAPLLREGRGAYLWGSASVIRDKDGKAVGAINTVKDFTEYKETQQQLKYYSTHDILTGLYNRSYFEEELKRLNNKRFDPTSVILCDVDGLKLINDSLGHHKGDELLKAAAGVIRSSFRSSDAVSRIGGDEFAVILPNTDHATVEESVKRIEDSINTYNNSNPEFLLSLSIGFATGSQPLQNIVIEADNSLNRSKLHRSTSAKSHFTATLMAMLAERDYITEGHADRLEAMASVMATAAGLASVEKTDLILLAKFHDIGKVGISDKLLFKPGPLTPDEKTEMMRHSEIGYRIAQSSPELSQIAKYILHHHEWWNGEGYPMGLKGEEIPLLCRIISILDTFDAMTNDRPYRKALSRQEVVRHLQNAKGIQFEPPLVDLFLEILYDKDIANF
ncbi:MAG: PAS domain S-box protein [Bacillota bacterium]|nr:PAS domain S-box protein [Bacillota bacterium]MDW7683590.1 PAS domain S-box protein [Bacillota bacterium]